MSYQSQVAIISTACDIQDRIKLSAMMQYFQEASVEHFINFGFPRHRLVEEGTVFLLNKISITISKRPEQGEEVIVRTRPIGTKGARFLREFRMDSLEGEVYAQALSHWILTDPATHKVLRPKSFTYNLEEKESMLENGVGDIKIPKRPQAAPELSSYSQAVRYSQLDTNLHVNNCVYGDLICDALPGKIMLEREIERVAIHFQHEAKWQENIAIDCFFVGEDTYLIEGKVSEKPCFEAYVELKKEGR